MPRKSVKSEKETVAALSRHRKDLMSRGVEMILQGMGVDITDEHFKDTPQRVAKMYKEMLTPPENNWTTFQSRSKGIVVLRNHRVIALCPHHLMPVEIKCYVAYLPDKRVLGLSKLARVVEQHLTKPIMQEELAFKVVESLEEALSPKGSAVVLAGVHGCMRFRGVESEGDVVTSELRGLFLHSDASQAELRTIIGRP